MVLTATMCAILIVRAGGMPWPKTGATHYHAQLGLLRQRSCNNRVDCLAFECHGWTASQPV